MSKFKVNFTVGDRVAVYTSGRRLVGRIHMIGWDGNPGVLRIEFEDGHADGRMLHSYTTAHPKQCRRLKPKRTYSVWVDPSAEGFGLAKNGHEFFSLTPREGWVEYRRVITPKVKP